MKMMQKISFNCKEATLLALQKEEKQLSFLVRLKLAVHVATCRYCKWFLKESKQMDGAMYKLDQSLFEHPIHFLSEEKKVLIKNQLDNFS